MNSKGNLIKICLKGKAFDKVNKHFVDWYNSIIEKDNKYLFVWLCRCTGNTIIRVLKNNNFVFYTTGHTGIDSKPNDLITFGCIRNPFLWYISLWSITFQRGMKNKNKFSKYLLRNHPRNYYYNIENPTDKKCFKNFLLFMINDYSSFWPHNDYSDIRKKYNIGYMTQVFFRMYNNNNYELLENISENPIIDFFIKQENLLNDINKYFNLNLSNLKNSSKSNHIHYSNYYDEELTKLIYEKDRYIFEKFNYKY